MANEELILERLIRLTKSGRIAWMRTKRGYKANLEGVRITVRVESGLVRDYCDNIYVEAPCRVGSSLGYYDIENFSEDLLVVIENQFGGESIDALEEKLMAMESEMRAKS